MIIGFARELRRLRDCQDGSGTIWGLLWFMLFLGIGGLAVDVSNAYRVRSVMQATADAIAHEAAMELPDRGASLFAAMAAAEKHMPAAKYGFVLTEANVEYGTWNWYSREFTNVDDTVEATAVRVVINADEANGNAIATSMLRILGLWSWDVKVLSAATRADNRCFTDGMLANDEVRMESENVFGKEYCVYGRNGLGFKNDNDFSRGAWAGRGSVAAESERCEGLDMQGSGGSVCDMSSNPGLSEGKFVSDRVRPDRLDILESTIAEALAKVDPANVFDQSQWTDKGGSQIKDISPYNVKTLLQTKHTDHTYYYLKCAKDTGQLEIPNGTYSNMTLITNCLMETQGGSTQGAATFSGVNLITISTASFNINTNPDIEPNVVIRGDSWLGTGCAPGQGVSIFTRKGVQFEGSVRYWGTEVTAGGDVLINGNNDAYSATGQSLSIHAAGNIFLKSRGQYGICDTTGPSTIILKRPALVL